MNKMFQQVLIVALGVMVAGVIMAAGRDIDFIKNNVTAGFDKWAFADNSRPAHLTVLCRQERRH